jgi:hypothetical protein
MNKPIFFLVFLLTACSSMPPCLNKEIGNFKSENQCVSAKVDEYTFQGKTVYVFDPGTCGADMTSKVVDKNCKVLGHLGGFAGNTKINGESFSTAVLVKTVWKR